MTAGYPYNVEPNYGPVSIVSSDDASKISAHPGMPSSQQSAVAHQQQPPMSSNKVERTKESPSTHENAKLSSQQQQQVSFFESTCKNEINTIPHH